MMRSQPVGVAPKAPNGLTAVATGGNVDVSWVDNAANETAFVLQRATDPGFTVGLTTINVGANVTSYRDNVAANGTYYYRVAARNVVGDTFDYSAPNATIRALFPTQTFDSGYSNVGSADVAVTVINAPTQLAATLLNNPLRIRLNWLDNATNNTAFVIQRSDNGGAFVEIARVGANAQAYADSTVVRNHVYVYRVTAVDANGSSSTYAEVTASLAPPVAPTNLAGTLTSRNRVTLTWTDNSNNESRFQIERATNATFTAGLVRTNVGANTTTTSIGNLPRNRMVYFRIRSDNNILGQSAWSNVFQVLTQ